MEQQLRFNNEHTTVSNNAKSNFIANISHDLRTPLHTMLGIAELLHIKQHYPEQEELIEGIIQSGKSLLHLVEQILQLSEVEAKNENITLENVDLRQLINDLTLEHQAAAKNKNLDLTFAYHETLPHLVKSNPLYLRRIISSLLCNAVKFTHQGHVRISVEPIKILKNQVLVQIIVEDTGIGIASHEIPHIFERFYRALPSYTGKHKGSGLGLAIAKQLTERLGGTLKVNSQRGVGTIFRCTLYFAQSDRIPDSLEQESRERKLHQPLARPLHVLLVEDEPLIQKFTCAMLLEFGCTVSIAPNGQAAINQLQQPFDIIFMDIGLPDISGLRVTQHIRENNNVNQNTPIIALTAHASAQDKARCLSTGVNDFLTKPASYMHFQRLLNKYQ